MSESNPTSSHSKAQEHPRVRLARLLAARFHKGQTRRGKEPYVNHPRRVAAVMKKRKSHPSFQVVAWLHDVMEDAGVTRAGLLDAGIQSREVDSICLLTRQPGQSYDDYLAKLRGNSMAREVKIFDILDNLADQPTSKQKRKYQKALQFLL